MKENKYNYFRLVFNLMILSLLVGMFIAYESVFGYLLVSLIFAYIFNPIIYTMEKYWIPRTFAIILLYLLIIGILFLIGVFLIPILIKQVVSLSATIKDFVSKNNIQFLEHQYTYYISTFLKKVQLVFPFINVTKYTHQLATYLESLASTVPSLFITYLGNFFTFMSYVVTVPIVGFFILKDKDVLKKQFISLIPNRYFELVLLVLEKIDETIGTYLRALMIEVIIVAILSVIGLFALGVPYALVIGIVAGLANAIPYFGPLIGILFACMSLIITGKPLILIVYVVGVMWVIQLLDNNIIYPLVIGKNTEMHPLIIMLTVMAGGFAFGLLGMFLSVPIVFLVKGVVQVLYKNLKEFEII